MTLTENQSVPPVVPPASQRRMVLISIALALVTLAVFGRTAWERFDFIGYDDQKYVSSNEVVRRGLNWEGVRWAFDPSSIVVANWHPITMISHMADCQVWGIEAWGHHLTNVLWHTVNVVLLFWLLARMTGDVWPSALVAALFAWHPLHVESVAWIAERKDMLSTFFWLLMIWSYTSYVRKRTWWRYALTALWLVLGLLSKPMLVTAPFLLLVLDYWPLGQFRDTAGHEDLRIFAKRVLEKLPLLAIVAAGCAVTLATQSGARMPWEIYSFETRFMNALLSYLTYLNQAAWPQDLAIPYLLSSRDVSVGRGLVCGAVLLAVTVLVVYERNRRPYLAVGWLWYLGTLVPVIGLMQVGVQSMADRYTYVPLIGIFLIIAWSLWDLVKAFPWAKWPVVAATTLWLAVLAVLCYRQTHYWHDKITLFTHTAAVTRQNHIAALFLGGAYKSAGRTDEALAQFNYVIEIAPMMFQGYLNKGLTLYSAGRFPEAAAELARAVRMSNDRMKPKQEFTAALVAAKIFATYPEESGRNAAAAIEMGERACAMTGYTYPRALDVLGMAYAEAGRFRDALVQADQARRIFAENNLPKEAGEIAARIRLYQQQMPYREEPRIELVIPDTDPG